MIIAGATMPTANEGEEQRSLFVWATIAAGKYPALNLLFHIPNEGKRSRWTGARMRSEGLKSGVPDPSKRDGRTSNRQLEHWAKERIDDAAFWERRYKGYRFVRCFARKNPFNGHWYLSVIMYRTDSDPPPWALEDWGVYE